MLAALKFFLGQDDKEDDDGEGDDEEAPAPTAPTRGDVYKATSKVQLRGSHELREIASSALHGIFAVWGSPKLLLNAMPAMIRREHGRGAWKCWP